MNRMFKPLGGVCENKRPAARLHQHHPSRISHMWIIRRKLEYIPAFHAHRSTFQDTPGGISSGGYLEGKYAMKGFAKRIEHVCSCFELSMCVCA